jgi:hypothetical protein
MTAPVAPARPLATAPEGRQQDGPAEGDTEKWAICCSGGGIRSASYSLGALQWLEGTNFLNKTRLVLGVSGGSYIAASRALVARGLEMAGDSTDPPAYAPGSPEEEHLRDNTRYLVPDAKTLLAGVFTLLFGVAVTLVLVFTPLFAVAHIWGWLLRSQGVLTETVDAQSQPPQWTSALTGTAWWIWPLITAGATAIIFVWWWITLIPNARGRERNTKIAVGLLGWTAFMTLALVVAMFVVPEVITWLSRSHSGALRTVRDGLGFGAGPGWNLATVPGFVVAVIALAQSGRQTLAKYNLVGSPAAARAPSGGIAGTVAGYIRGLVLPWGATALVLLALAVAALRWVKDGAAAGFTLGQLRLVIGALLVVLIMRFLADVNRISLHDFYRWRLGTAFAVQRKTIGPHDEPVFDTKDVQGALLSGLTGQQPQLVMCATANINARREVPPGRGGLSFTFDPEYATLRGPVPAETVRARTADYESLVGRRRFTLFDVSAISGAAFSPLMGAATVQAYRILFTATNLRLGVWLPHPAVVDAAARELDRQQQAGNKSDRWWHAVALLLWYMSPHPIWRHEDERPGGREARLWAYVLRLRRGAGPSRQFFGRLLYRALQPTLGLLYAEAAGHTSYRNTWMCVSDGGHYDNLGLVEALHRGQELGITHILVLDASGDQAHSWFTLGGSIALARSDAEIAIALDPMAMISPTDGVQLAQGQVIRPWASGTFTWPAAQQENTILVCKLGWWTGAPWDVQAYAAGHSDYPTTSTLDQLYNSAEFDAYRVLGAASIQLAMQDSEPAPPQTAPWATQGVVTAGEHG